MRGNSASSGAIVLPTAAAPSARRRGSSCAVERTERRRRRARSHSFAVAFGHDRREQHGERAQALGRRVQHRAEALAVSSVLGEHPRLLLGDVAVQLVDEVQIAAIASWIARRSIAASAVAVGDRDASRWIARSASVYSPGAGTTPSK